MPDLAIERETIALFERLLDIPEAEREAWLAAQAADRPDLLTRVNAMREADRRAQMRTGAAADALDEEPPPERIGAYRITERIGRGGMGSVYRGERMTGDFTHVVAIKIIKPGLLSETLVERFQRERQLLAGLSHPNIAQLYDGGETESGSPYFIMEFVDGLPLLQWVEEKQPGRGERQRLFCDICGAVAFAHRNLIVHRDLTPSNVLVTHHGTVKLIDFGIAKPADADDAQREPGARQSIGSLSLTPGYAAPERMISGDVTTAMDIYSLGKLLRRLLPPAPDDRELNAIIARATADDPLARYPTADSLGADVAAWQRGLPVAAMGGGRRYVISKFVERHRPGVAAAAAALLLLLGAFALTLHAYSGAEAARRAEAARFEELRSLARYMLFDLNGRLERVVGNTQARATLADRAQHYLSALAASSHADDDLKLEAAQGFIALAEAQGVPAQPNLGNADQAKANLQTAIGMLRGVDRPAAATGPDLVRALSDLAMIQGHVETNTEAADRTLGEAASILERVPANARGQNWHGARRFLRKAQLELTTLAQRPDEMLRLANLMEAEIGQWPAAMQRSREAALDRAYAAYHRGLHGYFTDALDESLAALLHAERQFVRLERSLPNDPVVLYALMWTGYVGYGTASGLPSQRAEAERLLEVARATSARLMLIEANDSALRSFAGNVRQMQAQALSARGRHRQAIAEQREVVRLYEAALGPRRRASSLNRLAMAQITLGNIASAANDAALGCSSYRAARVRIADLQRRRELLGFVESHLAGLNENIARCARNAPMSEMEVLE